MPPTLETPRLRLREWRLADFDAFADFRACAAHQAHVGSPVPREQAWGEFCAKAGEWQVRGLGTFLVARRDTDAAVGYTGLWYPPDIGEPELCWSLFPGYTGKGLATEAALAARDWAYRALNLAPLMSFVHPDNRASRAVAERLGARLERETTLRGEPRLCYRHPGPA